MEAYGVAATADELVKCGRFEVLQAVQSGDPARIGQAYEKVLTAAETLGKLSQALVETCRRVSDMDEFDWSAVEDAEDVVRRKEALTRATDIIDAWVV